MTHQYLMHLLQSKEQQKFDHFDYVEAIQNLTPLEMQAHPKKKRLVDQFASRCRQTIDQEQKEKEKEMKRRNFLERMLVYEQIRKQKLQALRFIEEKYDSKNKQLLFYPKVNRNLATQKMKYWKDVDGFEAIEHESSIYVPRQSIFDQDEEGLQCRFQSNC